MSEPGYELFVRNLLSNFIFAVQKTLPDNEPDLLTPNLLSTNRIKCMLHFIHDNYSKKITLLDLAKEASISESEVLRCFHANIRTTPAQYLKQYRLEKSVQLLLETDFTSSEIAYTCGFGSSSYFTKTFREHFGCPPLEYKKREKNYS